MTNEIKNVPELRFPEFNEQWEMKKLKYISSINPKLDSNFPSSFNYIDLESVNKGKINKTSEFTNENAPSRAQRVAQKGDVFFQTVRPYQQNNFVFLGASIPTVVSTGYAQIRSNINSSYIYNLLLTTTFLNKVLVNCTGSNYPAINSNDLSNILIMISTNKDEQKKIGDFFSKLDRQIELEEQKLEKLEEQKKGYMQKIFSQELRFKDENGNDYPEWGENTLGEITNITTGSLDANAMVANGKYKFFTCARETYQIDNYAFDTEALLISGNGANVGYIHHYKGKFNAYQRTYVLDRIETNIYFLKYYLEKNLIKRIYSEKRDGNTPYITRSTLYDMEINIPISNQEQQKIGDFFKKVDELIETQFSKVELLKERKKGFLQKMFV